MARKPNYGFEKKQRELKRQKKKEKKAEKRRLKKEAAVSGDAPVEGSSDSADDQG